MDDGRNSKEKAARMKHGQQSNGDRDIERIGAKQGTWGQEEKKIGSEAMKIAVAQPGAEMSADPLPRAAWRVRFGFRGPALT